jgi:hypothetical protein
VEDYDRYAIDNDWRDTVIETERKAFEAGRVAGIREAAAVCEERAKGAAERQEHPHMHIDSASRYAARARSLRHAAEAILALLTTPTGAREE